MKPEDIDFGLVRETFNITGLFPVDIQNAPPYILSPKKESRYQLN